MEDRVFSLESSKQISDQHIAVKLLGGDDTTPETRAFMTRYGIRGYPTLLIMNADGVRLDEGKVGRTVDEILAAVDGGKKVEAQLAEAAKGDETEYMALLKKHMDWNTLGAMIEKKAAAAPTAELHEDLHEIYAKTGDMKKADALMETMISTYKDHEKRPGWRVAVAKKPMNGVNSIEEYKAKVPGAIDSLNALIKAADEEKDLKTGVAARLELGNLLSGSDRHIGRGAEADALFDWIIENHADTNYAPTAQMGKANRCWSKKDFAGCRAALQVILDKWPDSEEAKIAPRGIENCDKKMAK
jgi:hypothetical protein